MNFYQTYEPFFALLTVYVFLTGACIGSFLNVVILRLPENESIVRVPSHCPKCNAKIRFYHNIPIISWLMLRGRCSSCHKRISARYIFVEAFTALIFMAVWFQAWRLYRLNPVAHFPKWPLAMVIGLWILFCLLIVISFIDLDTYVVPDSLVIFGVIVGLILAIGWPGSHEFGAPPGSFRYLGHRPILAYFGAKFIYPYYPKLLIDVRALACLNWFLGILFGGGILWAISELGKLIRGKKTFRELRAIEITMDAEGYTTPEDGMMPWEDTFIRRRDKLRIEGELLELKVKENVELPEDYEREGMFILDENGLILGETVVSLEDIESAKFSTRCWTIPLEAMGLGDATLMAMIGAFLGPLAVIFILFLASVIGTFLGLGKILCKEGKMHTAIPFGPSIAAATFLYVMLRPALV